MRVCPNIMTNLGFNLSATINSIFIVKENIDFNEMSCPMKHLANVWEVLLITPLSVILLDMRAAVSCELFASSASLIN